MSQRVINWRNAMTRLGHIICAKSSINSTRHEISPVWFYERTVWPLPLTSLKKLISVQEWSLSSSSQRQRAVRVCITSSENLILVVDPFIFSNHAEEWFSWYADNWWVQFTDYSALTHIRNQKYWFGIQLFDLIYHKGSITIEFLPHNSWFNIKTSHRSVVRIISRHCQHKWLQLIPW